jgi:ATP-binding protein involved in chromosome partitioning
MALTEKDVRNLLQDIPGLENEEISNSIASIHISENKLYISLEQSKTNETINTAIQERLKKALPEFDVYISLVGHKTPPQKPRLNNVGKVFLVASGKGGVGKSTIAALLATQFNKEGLKVGLLDADVYGPSLPTLTGINTPPELDHNKQIIPHQFNGIACMSMGFLVPQDQAFIWRGPMVMGAINKLLFDVNWGHQGKLDALVIDMPPGTGDAHLSLAQKIQVDGAIMVSTPHPLALADLSRGIDMFQKAQVPILGLVENMSFTTCQSCGNQTQLYTQGPLEELYTQYNLPLLGSLPFNPGLLQRNVEFKNLDTSIEVEINKIFKQILTLYT